jgi:phospholipid/cholesterol/gamma-HCH transport system ATP-binding protein
MNSIPVIEVRGLCTRVGGQVIHENLDLVVERGDFVALVGESGGGKTTLLREIVGLIRPVRGEVHLFGSGLARAGRRERRALQRRFGLLFQNGALFSALNVFDNVALPLRELRCLPESMIRDLVMLKLSMVELQPRDALRMPAQLSGGMVKRVALARALALDPELLLLDEPTAGLDPGRSQALVHLLRALAGELGLTMVMITHDIETLTALATRVAVLADRRIVADGPLQQVLRCGHPFVAEFFGQQPGLLHSGHMAAIRD